MNPSADGAGVETTRRGADGTDESDIARIERSDRAVVAKREVGPVYEGSDGRFYTGWQVDRKVAEGDWKPCIRDLDDERRLVGTNDGGLVMLVRIDPAALPEWAELRAEGDAVRVVDTRRSSP